ncbi:MAG: NAD+ synthase [archaeon]|nr:MAG: NAD+ synthase [archaeon]
MIIGPLAFDADSEKERIASFVRRIVRGAAAKGVVLGLSGGVDSAVAGAIAVEALGKKRVTGLLMPSASTPKADVEDARKLARGWGIRSHEIPIGGIVAALEGASDFEGTKLAKANLQARARMTVLYYYSNSKNLLVLGTGDRSEVESGFFTKWGDGGVDLLPIAHLYKTQVRALGKSMGLPKRVVEKPASPQLWTGHKAEDELPAPYEKLDLVLYCLFDEDLSKSRVAKKAEVPVAVVEEALRMNKRSEHKRRMPPSLSPAQNFRLISTKD